MRTLSAVAAESARNDLLTAETTVSRQQTDKIREDSVRLVTPRGLFGTFTSGQQPRLIDPAGFMGVVRERENG